MSQEIATYCDQPTQPDPPRGHPILAWLVIVVMVLAILFVPAIRPAKQSEKATSLQERLGLLLVGLQGRVFVAAADIENDPKGALAQIQPLNSGSISQRIRFIVLVGELDGPEAALIQIKDLEAKVSQQPGPDTPTQKRILQTLGLLYLNNVLGKFGAAALPPDDQSFLIDKLGWFGELALAAAQNPDPGLREQVLSAARRTLFNLIGILVAVVVLVLAGFIGGCIFLIMLFSGRLQGGLTPTSASHGVYAEAFALWIVLFFGFDGAVDLGAAPANRLALLGLASLVSLVAVFWPVLRGIPWSQVRQDIGWTSGRKPLLEPFLGAACYVMALPLLMVAVAIVLALMALLHFLQQMGAGGDNYEPAQPLVHPIVESILAPDWWLRFQVLMLACVTAPIVEETMFRGMLYRHLRGATSRFRPAFSFLFSALVVSFIFAVIHPQGFIAVPLLMTLALAFNIAREWRGTLIPGMVAHAVTNGMTVLLLLMILGE
jgi:membrane protease YdiL (CAAX protease family)